MENSISKMINLPVLLQPFLFVDKSHSAFNLNLTELAAAITGENFHFRIEMVLHTGYVLFNRSYSALQMQPDTAFAATKFVQDAATGLPSMQLILPASLAQPNVKLPPKLFNSPTSVVTIIDRAAVRGHCHLKATTKDVAASILYQHRLRTQTSELFHFHEFCNTVSHILCQNPEESLLALEIISNQIANSN